MKTAFIKMLKSVEVDGQEYAEGELYELDAETATKWIEAKRCEAADDPSEKLYDELNKSVEEKINKAVAKITETIRVESKAPAVPKDDSDKSLGDFVKMFATGEREKLTNKYGNVFDSTMQKVLNTSDDSALIPTPLWAELLESSGGNEGVYDLVQPRPMTSMTQSYIVLDQPGVSPSGGSSAFFGGCIGGFDNEDDDANATEPAFDTRTITAKKYTMHTYTTLELRSASAVDVGNEVTRLFGSAYRQHMGYHLLNGSATVEGVIDDTATVAVARKTANKINYQDVAEMYSRMASDSAGWTWIVGRGPAFAQLLQLEDGDGHLVFQPSAREGVPGSLLGLPVIRSEHCGALGAAGDLILGNFADGYLFGQLYAPVISFSDHVGFIKGRRCLKLEAIVAGKPKLAGPITLADGSTEVSNFIQLDDPAS